VGVNLLIELMEAETAVEEFLVANYLKNGESIVEEGKAEDKNDTYT
jgi:hypothetical protein